LLLKVFNLFFGFTNLLRLRNLRPISVPRALFCRMGGTGLILKEAVRVWGEDTCRLRELYVTFKVYKVDNLNLDGSNDAAISDCGETFVVKQKVSGTGY